MEERGEIAHGLGGELRRSSPDPTGAFTDRGRGRKVGLYIYDPKQGKVVKDYGGVGPSHATGVWCRGFGVDDQYAYLLSGDLPVYLLSVNLKSGETKVLLERPHLLAPSRLRMEIVESLPGRG